MLFASPTFLFFFLPLCLAAYFLMPGMRAKNALLLAASLIFYAWGEPIYVALMVFMTVFNYAAALVIDSQEAGRRSLRSSRMRWARSSPRGKLCCCEDPSSRAGSPIA